MSTGVCTRYEYAGVYEMYGIVPVLVGVYEMLALFLGGRSPTVVDLKSSHFQSGAGAAHRHHRWASDGVEKQKDEHTRAKAWRTAW